MFDLDKEILKFLRHAKCGGSISFLSNGQVTMINDGKFYVGETFDKMMIEVFKDHLDIINNYVPVRGQGGIT